jgi:hypothetical protein
LTLKVLAVAAVGPAPTIKATRRAVPPSVGIAGIVMSGLLLCVLLGPMLVVPA